MSVNVDGVFPYNKIKGVVTDGQAMVYIPKFYVKHATITSGPRSGCYAHFISPTLQDGYHVHPAFMYLGHEVDGIEVAAYLTSFSTTGVPQSLADGKLTPLSDGKTDLIALGKSRNDGSTSGAKSGWFTYNIYVHHALALLMLVEYATTDLQTILGPGPSTVYRGIHNPWGGIDANYGVALPGLRTTGVSASPQSEIQVFDVYGNGSWVSTGVSAPMIGSGAHASGYVVDMHTETGTNFNLADLFIAKTVDPNASNGTYADAQDFTSGGSTNNQTTDVVGSFTTYPGVATNTVTECGMFSLRGIQQATGYGFHRLCRYATASATASTDSGSTSGGSTASGTLSGQPSSAASTGTVVAATYVPTVTSFTGVTGTAAATTVSVGTSASVLVDGDGVVNSDGTFTLTV